MRLIHSILSMLALTVCTTVYGASESGAGAAPSPRDQAPEILRRWMDARAGTGKPVYWIGEGDIYASPSGEKLFGIMGFDASTVIWPAEFKGQKAVQLTRKVYALTDPKTGEVLTEYKGKVVEGIAFPYQVFTYWLENGRIRATAEYGIEPNLIKTTSVNGLGWRSMGADTLVVNAPVFVNHTMPNGKHIESWESYDFFLHAPGTVAVPYQLTFVVYHDLPAWAGEGKAVNHMVSWRVESPDEFPPKLLAWAKANASMWLMPPKDMKEIRALQQPGQSGIKGWIDKK